jgi:methanogenic corrinoid protein MtbC1
VIELGANTPPEAFAETIRDEAPIAAVGVFSAFSHEGILEETIDAIRETDPHVPVVLGGPAVAGFEPAEGLSGLKR